MIHNPLKIIGFEKPKLYYNYFKYDASTFVINLRKTYMAWGCNAAVTTWSVEMMPCDWVYYGASQTKPKI